MIAFTDGSTAPTNPGPGGFGVVLLDNNKNLIRTYNKKDKDITTNNRQEMKAILYAIGTAILNNEDIIIFADSAYAINSFTVWRESWEKNNWKTSKGEEPKNLDLIQAYVYFNKFCKVKFEKIKGHQGIYYNELADKLAKFENI